jgi:hypothetical protein
MDCERFEAALIDELYNELDELTSAATKRHAAGCARCASLLGGLRATRRVAVLPQIEPSMDLEDRILAAAREAQRVVPVGRKVSRAISWAGSWAMRPQTAMAAVFILMVGSSVLFVRRRKVADNATVTVTAEGAPAISAAAPADDSAPLDSKVAAAAHGAGPVTTYAPLTPPTASAAPQDTLGGIGKDSLDSKGAAGSVASVRRGAAADDPELDVGHAKNVVQNVHGPVEGRAPQQGAPIGAGALGGASDDRPKSAQAQVADSRVQAPLDQAKSLYVARDYVAATNAYDAIAAGGDLDAALGAARSVREGNGGCAIAKDRFDQIAARAWGTTVGYEATLEGGKCYRALGATDTAQAHYAKLLTVQQFAPLAQAEINTMTQVAARASSRKSQMSKPAATLLGGAAAASPSAQQAPSQAAPSQPRMPSPQKPSAQ